MLNQEFDQLEAKIKQNLAEINAAISQAAKVSGRTGDEITLLAISKRQPVKVIEAAYQCGQRAFGESYVQEALEKMERFSEFDDIRWDLVGHVQSRKARQVAENFHAVHSLDSMKLANLLNQYRPVVMPPLEVFLEVNVGDESSKAGFPMRNSEDWEVLVQVVRQILGLERLKFSGSDVDASLICGFRAKSTIFYQTTTVERLFERPGERSHSNATFSRDIC